MAPPFGIDRFEQEIGTSEDRLEWRLPSGKGLGRYPCCSGACAPALDRAAATWHDAVAAGCPVSREAGFARSTGPRSARLGLAVVRLIGRGELVRHRVRSLTTSVAFAVSLLTIAVAPGAHAGAGPAA